MIAFVIFTLVSAASLHRNSPGLYSPVYVVAGPLAVIGIAGFLSATVFASDDRGAVSAIVELSADDNRRTLSLFLLASTAVLLGDMLIGGPEVRIRLTQASTMSHGWRTNKLLARTTLGVGVASLLLLSVGVSVTDVLQRSQYLEYPHGLLSAQRVGAQLSLAGLVASAFLTANRSARLAAFGWLLCALHLLFFFGMGSRRLALVPALVFLGRSASLGLRSPKWRIAAVAVATLFLIGLPIHLRSLPEHGIIPYLSALPNYLRDPTSAGDSLKNILFGFPLAGEVAFNEPSISLTSFLVSINPMPGEIAGWYKIAPSLRLNIYTPYSALGELRNGSSIHLITYCLVLGGVLGRAKRLVQLLVGSGRAAFALPIVAFAGLLAVTMTQYNLRTTNRLLLYFCVLLGVAYVATGRFLGQPSMRPEPVPQKPLPLSPYLSTAQRFGTSGERTVAESSPSL